MITMEQRTEAEEAIENAELGTGSAEQEQRERAAVAALNGAFGYEVLWPVAPDVARDLADLAGRMGREDVAKQMRQAFNMR